MKGTVTMTAAQLQFWGESIALGVCEQFGVKTMISYRQGVATYGQFFRDCVSSGRLQEKKTTMKKGKREFAVRDILALIAEEDDKACLMIRSKE